MTRDDFRYVLLEIRERTAWLTVNRPEKLNALSRATMEDIGAAFEAAVAAPEVRVVVLTGAGEKAFVAGADIGEMSKMNPAEAHEFSRFLQRVLDRIERARKPVIAAVNGYALGGGNEIAMACHIRIASENARFGQPEVGLGLIPGAGGTQRLPRIVGRGAALDLILRGEAVDAAEALRIGLVSRVVPQSALVETVGAYAATLGSKSPTALAHALEAVISGAEMPLEEAQRMEAALFALGFSTEDVREGTGAFLEKRKPSFPGR
jgi:enoyl-CoA hydratase